MMLILKGEVEGVNSEACGLKEAKIMKREEYLNDPLNCCSMLSSQLQGLGRICFLLSTVP